MIELFRKNLSAVRQRIDDAAVRSGRRGDDVTLVAVTKYVDADVTRQMFDAGAKVAGENRPQMLSAKAAELSDVNAAWHMIGSLQRNKVRQTVEHATLIHSVDRNKLLNAIAGEASAERPVRCLLEVNISGEESKHGFAVDELADAIEHASTLDHVLVQGLMCMASLAGGPDDARREFASLRELRDQHAGTGGANVNLADLSMGMSGDFEIAIEEGATIVRVGSALYEGTGCL